MLFRFRWRIVVALLLLTIHSAVARTDLDLILNSRSLHLRSGDKPEWDEFAGKNPDARRLDLHFTAQSNVGESTLFIRQDEVKEDWVVQLNGKRLGNLFLMEADLIHNLAVPAGALRDGDNLLSIVPPKALDDIVVQEIRISSRPATEAIHESTLDLKVLDQMNSGPLPCRLTIVDAEGTLVPLIALTNKPFLAVRPGVVYTGNGEAEIGLPAGDYTVYASRGFEWSVATQTVHLASKQSAQIALQLRHEVQTAEFVSCDTHIHTFTLSRHGDATLDERMLTLAGEGIELPIATDHNVLVDYTESARRTGVQRWFTPVIGDEVTTQEAHFNIFPIETGSNVPDWHLTNWPGLMSSFRSTPGVQVVILNHPYNVHTGFQPFAKTNFNAASGDNKYGPEFSFDALELVNSSAQQSDYMRVYRSWFALLNHGYKITGVGSSDCHDVSRYIVGQSRTYISCPDANPGQLNVSVACSNLLAGRASVSMGLLTDLTVNGKFKSGDLATGVAGAYLKANLKVRGPSWVSATNFALYANGIKASWPAIHDEKAVSAEGDLKASVTWTIPRPTNDLYLVAIATGPGVVAPFWPIARPYQPVSTHWDSRVIGSTNPLWIDGDDDGKYTSARGYALRLIKQYGSDYRSLLKALNPFDEAVATQAASLIAVAGSSVSPDDLASASPHVKRGFEAFEAEF
ncbi:MAG: hypothetical protein JWM99_359 [Verrucomicrobiales bacterium]|nr:hypothetical protein [Verrucomicrobiales bacterium]